MVSKPCNLWFNVKYCPGRNNADADGLSRWPTDTNIRQYIYQKLFRTTGSSVSSIPYVECMTISPDLVKGDINDLTTGTPISLTGRNPKNTILAQHGRECTITWKRRQHLETSVFSSQYHQWHTLSKKLPVINKWNNQLYCQQYTLQLYSKQCTMIWVTLGRIELCHYWRTTFTDQAWLEMWKSGFPVVVDIRRKTHRKHRAPLVSIEIASPLQLVCMYCLTLVPSKGGQ